MSEDYKVGDILEGQISMNAGRKSYFKSPKIEKELYIHKTNTNKSLHLDQVKVQIIEGKKGHVEGRVLWVVERFKKEFVGRIKVSKKYAFLIPDSKKMGVDIFVPLKHLGGATDGQKVVVKMTKWEDGAKSPNGKVVEVLGNTGDNDTEIHSILHEYGLPYRFDDEVTRESENISDVITEDEISKRRDMRDILTFTIDPDTAKDFDDALSVEWVDGKLQVGVHIADVSHYIQPKTELDKEASYRATSVYLVDRVVPMLPEKLSNGLCSLRPNEDKLCFSAVFTLDNNGHILDEWFGRTVIHSDHRFTYEEAQHIIESSQNGLKPIQIDTDLAGMGGVDKVLVNSLSNSVIALDKTAKKMRKKRHKQGSISLDKQEVRFDLDSEGKPIGIKFKIQKDANKLIEEYMLLANRRVAKYLKSKGVCVNRVHDEPDKIKLESLKEFITPLGYQIKTNSVGEITSSLNRLLTDIKGTAEENMIGSLVVRSMKKAIYTTENVGHYGLGFPDYTHFTSPIRRYPDVLTHRLLDSVLKGTKTTKVSELESMCVHSSNMEVKAQKASRDSIKLKQCEYMSDKIGLVYHDCVVTSVQDYGMFVEIPETASEGMVKLSDISGDTYQSDTDNHRVVGYNTGSVIRLGDVVSIVVKNVDIEKKRIDLELIRL